MSAALGTATIAFAYLAGRELGAKRAGLLAALAVALDPYLIWYSQEARSYALLIAAGAAALYFFARALRDPGRRSLAGGRPRPRWRSARITSPSSRSSPRPRSFSTSTACGGRP